ncbi:ribose 5-phosphate isomerase [Solidesulfovibrio carbinoliphilus subsp. oakridgensis]|uniref:Ribose-5-phosphate isomerase A n=1 Tax=Solidesulfovibrio carbinoliphilus subsp. oakridgensis TaxID=694327 RepID=G7Q9K5_9BACT|nr:ribose-5-phosphate isomerase RpiA [Solidesulfovibrio carbinoliphilus]EHJ48645.1 ribose 5-phosphate isomerase [Solidesulfovibrio carbinoliphilus subsp. oakridgensis]
MTPSPRVSPEVARGFKQAAAAHAAALVEAGMAVGLGHGSTAVEAVPVLADRAGRGELAGTVFVPAARFMAEALRRHGLPVGSLDDRPELDLAIDGADEIDPNLDCIKGGGGALLYEKIVGQAAKRLVIVADAGKLSPRLGTRHPLPVEITPFALASELRFLAGLGGHPALRLRPDGDPMRTERGNVIADCPFGPMADPAGLAAALDARGGVAGHGLFIGLAALVVVAGEDGVRELRR